MKIIQRLKEEWLNRNEAKLKAEYASNFEVMRKNFDKEMNERMESYKKAVEIVDQNLKIEKAKLEIRENEVKEIERSIEDKKIELAKKNEDLANQIRLIEAKASPDQVWVSAFGLGFSKAWDMMMPLMNEGNVRSRKIIEDQAIAETVKRMSNGNYKKNN